MGAAKLELASDSVEVKTVCAADLWLVQGTKEAGLPPTGGFGGGNTNLKLVAEPIAPKGRFGHYAAWDGE